MLARRVDRADDLSLVPWVRMARQGVGLLSAHRTLTHMAHFERWAGQRLDRGPEAIDRELLEDYLAHVRRLPHSDFEREARLVSLDTMLSLARALDIESLPRRRAQRFLSHESGAMTDVYAHMLDQTLKQELGGPPGRGSMPPASAWR